MQPRPTLRPMLLIFLVISIKTPLKTLIMNILLQHRDGTTLPEIKICGSFATILPIETSKPARGRRIRYFDFLLFKGLASSGSSGWASSLNSTSFERELTVLSALLLVSSLSVPRRM